jgi:hypothetical protein
MPISRRTREANQSPPADPVTTLQARVLAVLMPDDLSDPTLWPLVTRKYLDMRAGFTGKSGSTTRALNGIRPGNTTSGNPHPGLIERGLVEKVVLDIEGVDETNYRATAAGIAAYQAHIAKTGGKLPKVKDAIKNTNRRYRS